MTDTIPILDHGYLKLIETWGSDERIVEAARMSTDGAFRGWGPKEDGSAGDEKLLAYLYRNKHSSPSEMAGMVIEVQAPIFVFREWQRHRTQSYNELSARYTELPELFYVPSAYRVRRGGKSGKGQTGNGEIDTVTAEKIRNSIRVSCEQAFDVYRDLLDAGLSRELARLVLPVNTYSRMRASANLRNWLAFLTLRLADSAQWEIRQYACHVSGLIRVAFPRTWELFATEGKGE